MNETMIELGIRNGMATTGSTTGLLEEIHDLQPHPVVMQVRRLLKGGTEAYTLFGKKSVAKRLLEIAKEGAYYSKDAMHQYLALEQMVINQAMNEAEASVAVRKGGNTKGTKLADVYRKFRKVLIQITKSNSVNSANALETYNNLYLDQTLSDTDLETPEYLDGYTNETVRTTFSKEEVARIGELAAKEHGWTEEQILDFSKEDKPVPTRAQRELEEQSQNTAADLGWSEETRLQFLKAQGGFVEDIDEEESKTDDRGYIPPTMLDECKLLPEITSDLWKHSDVLNDFRNARQTFFKWQLANIDPKLQAQMSKAGGNYWLWAFEQARDGKVEFFPAMNMHDRHERLIEEVSLMARQFEHIYIIAFLNGVSGEYGVDPHAFDNLMVMEHNGSFIKFPDAYEEWADTVLEMLNDSIHSGTPMSETPEALAKWEEQFLYDFRRACDDTNPLTSRIYSVAYIEAIGAGATIKDANASAWAAWKARQVSVKSINGKFGLNLEGGRKVDWGIATMKLRNNELALDEHIAGRLYLKLHELGIKNQFTVALGKWKQDQEVEIPSPKDEQHYADLEQ